MPKGFGEAWRKSDRKDYLIFIRYQYYTDFIRYQYHSGLPGSSKGVICACAMPVLSG